MSQVEDEIIEAKEKEAEDITIQTDKLWSEYGKLQAQREQYAMAHQQITGQMQQIQQEIHKLAN